MRPDGHLYLRVVDGQRQQRSRCIDRTGSREVDQVALKNEQRRTQRQVKRGNDDDGKRQGSEHSTNFSGRH
ncbi:hypothetical protein D3C72_2263480 [compost metagenome]